MDDIEEIIEIAEDDEIFDENEEDINIELLTKQDKKTSKKITPPIMSSKEKTVVIGKRWKQLDNNYKTTIPEIVKKEGIEKSYDIAIREFELGKIPPYIIKRKFNNGTYEEWKHEDFKFFPNT